MGQITAFLICIIVFVLFILLWCRKIVPHDQVFIVERLGSFHAEWGAGLHFLVPFTDKIAGRVSLSENAVDFKPQPYITKDNVTVQIEISVSYQVTSAKDYVYGIDNPMAAFEKLTAVTLRTIISEMKLDDVHRSGNEINKKLTLVLAQATERWGIKVNRIEIKKILRC